MTLVYDVVHEILAMLRNLNNKSILLKELLETAMADTSRDYSQRLTLLSLPWQSEASNQICAHFHAHLELCNGQIQTNWNVNVHQTVHSPC